jgi:hypothetical protein
MNNDGNNNNLGGPAAALPGAVVPAYAPIVAKRAADGSAACYLPNAAKGKSITTASAASDVPAPCIGCNLANGCADAQGAVVLHEPGACLIPTAAYGPCMSCNATMCVADCRTKAVTTFERAQLYQIATISFGAKSVAAQRTLEDSVEVWRLNGTSAELNKTNTKVDGINVITLNKRRLAGYGGGFSISDGHWAAAGAGAETAVSFLQKNAVVELPGYSGPHVRPVFVARPPIVPQGVGQGPDVAQLNARIKELEEANMAAAQATADLQARVISAEDVAKQFQLRDAGGSAGEAAAAALATRAQMGLGSEAGALSSRQAFDMGKVLLSFSQVFAENSVASKLSHVPILPSVCGRSGGRSVKEIKLPWWNLQHEPTELPDNLRSYLEDKFALFHKLLETYGSQNLLPEGFYTAAAWHQLFRRLHAYANDSYEAAIARGDAAAIRRTPLHTIIREADDLAVTLVSKAILRHEVIDLNMANEPCLQRAFTRIEPARSEGKRGPDKEAREQMHTPGADMQKRPKPDVSQQICDNFNTNKGACKDGAATCKNGRRHICTKCGMGHARCSSPACR